MPFIVGLLRSHIRYVPLLNENQRSYSLCEGFGEVEKLVIYINDQTQEITIEDRNIEILPIPYFENLLEKLLMPFSILNS
jgi:hypothetical protein